MDSTSHAPRSSPVSEVFDALGLTAHGGANLLIDFIRNKLQLPRHLDAIPVRKAWWATYSVALDLEYLLTAYALGVERISHTGHLEYDPLLCTKLGLDKLPQHCTL